jgi:hypothetical protein
MFHTTSIAAGEIDAVGQGRPRWLLVRVAARAPITERRRGIGAAVARRGVPYLGEHWQAAECAAADIEGYSATAKFSQPGRLSAVNLHSVMCDTLD